MRSRGGAAVTQCCDEYGQCQQSHGCPARTTPLITKHGGERIDTDCGTSENIACSGIAAVVFPLLLALAALVGWLL